MPLFLCRWPNGDCSVVWAPTKDEAIVELDQAGNAEACPMMQVRSFQAHFVLTDRGELALDALGEGTGQEIISRAYPLLDKALSEADDDGVYDGCEGLPPNRRAAIEEAVKAERNRIAVDQRQTQTPLTELGRDVKRQTDAPTVLVDRLVSEVAAKKLTHFRGPGKPS